MTKRSSILIVILSFMAWPGQAQTSVPRDTVITLQRFADAFGNGGFYKLTITADGTVALTRFRNPSRAYNPNEPDSKTIHSKLTIEKLTGLVADIDRIKYFSLNDTYTKTTDGCPGVIIDQGGAETSVTMNGKTKSIAHYYGCCKFYGDQVTRSYITRFDVRPNKSLDASGGSVFLNLLGAAKGALIRAAASTQTLCRFAVKEAFAGFCTSGTRRCTLFQHKSAIKILFATLLLVGAAIHNDAAAQTISRDESLKPYTTCQFEDGLKVVEVDRLPKDVTFRTENTSSGEKQISLADGYRVMVAYPKTDFFANIKAEKSNPAKYPTDKEIAIEALKWAITTSKEMESQEPTKLSYNGYEGHAINRKALVGNTLGISVLFSDADHHIVTIYFLNQNPKKRKFQTIEEGRTLRDNFLKRYTTCAKGISSVQP